MSNQQRTSKPDAAVLSTLLAGVKIPPEILKLLLLLLLLGELRFKSGFQIIEGPVIPKRPSQKSIRRSESYFTKKPRERFL